MFYLAILPVSRHTWAAKSASHNSLQHRYRHSRSRNRSCDKLKTKKKKDLSTKPFFSTCAQPRKYIDDWIDNWMVCDSLLPVEWARSIIPIKETPDLSALCVPADRDNREETRASEVNSIDRYKEGKDGKREKAEWHGFSLHNHPRQWHIKYFCEKNIILRRQEI